MCRYAALFLAISLIALGQDAHAQEAVTVRVMSFNVWYGGEQVSLPKVAEAIRAAQADIVGLQETDGNLERIAAAAGMPYVDPRRRIISRWPIFDSGVGERTQSGASLYSTTGLDLDALHAWVMVSPGKVVGVANVHLSSDPSGLEIVREGGKLADVLALEEQGRAAEAKPLAFLGQVAKDGTPVFLTGDFNTPSHLDWTDAAKRAARIPFVVPWPTTVALAKAGLRDSYREANPDPLARLGITWTPGAPHPIEYPDAGRERIDMIWTAGRSTTLASQVVGEPGGPDVEIGVAPWPSDHRAVVSTFRVIPKPAPPMVSVIPRRVMEGERFLLRTYDPTGETWTAYIVPRGGNAKDAILGVKELPAHYQRSILLSTLELPPANYDAVLVGRDGSVLKRHAFTVATKGSRPEMEMVEAVLKPGAPIRARWRNTPGDLRDWIGIYAAGETDVMHYLGFGYTEAMFDGEGVVDVDPKDAPLPPGDYELRLMHDETYVDLARARFSIKP
jgi:endonuclease/exonuclease/phosphatase family metal-dependent hydrolase